MSSTLAGDRPEWPVPLKCRFCFKIFQGAEATTFKKHLETHKKMEKPYQCLKCSYSSRQRRGLVNHLKLHDRRENNIHNAQLYKDKLEIPGNSKDLEAKNNSLETAKGTSSDDDADVSGEDSNEERNVYLRTPSPPPPPSLPSTSARTPKCSIPRKSSIPTKSSLRPKSSLPPLLPKPSETPTSSLPPKSLLIPKPSPGPKPIIWSNFRMEARKSKNVTCVFCFKILTDRFKWQEHIRSHTGERPFKCRLCSYTCAREEGITSHIKSHKGPVLRCPVEYCRFSASFSKALKKHLTQVHKESDKDSLDLVKAAKALTKLCEPGAKHHMPYTSEEEDAGFILEASLKAWNYTKNRPPPVGSPGNSSGSAQTPSGNPEKSVENPQPPSETPGKNVENPSTSSGTPGNNLGNQETPSGNLRKNAKNAQTRPTPIKAKIDVKNQETPSRKREKDLLNVESETEDSIFQNPVPIIQSQNTGRKRKMKEIESGPSQPQKSNPKGQGNPQKMFSCPKCDYETISEKSFKLHSRLHFSSEDISVESPESEIIQIDISMDSEEEETVEETQEKNEEAQEKIEETEENLQETEKKIEETEEQNMTKSPNLKTGKRPRKPFSCPDCEFQTFNKKSLFNHGKQCHSSAKNCPECDYSTTSDTSLRNHVRIHKMPFKCSFCPKTSASEVYVKEHERWCKPRNQVGKKEQEERQV